MVYDGTVQPSQLPAETSMSVCASLYSITLIPVYSVILYALIAMHNLFFLQSYNYIVVLYADI